MKVTIIGLGLIGGSMAISLKESGFATEIIGVDREQETLDKALRRKIIDTEADLEAGVQKGDIVILATPVDVLLQLLPKVLDLAEHQAVLDVGSTKVNLLEKVRNHPRRGRLVATHPMAGTEHSGIEAAIPHLFEGKYTVFCDVDDSDPDAVDRIEQLYSALQMKIVRLDAHAHDIHTAYVSHISHITSFALALTVLEKEKDEHRIFELASSGFDSTVRLAKSSPDMWMPIFRQNRDNLLDVLDEHINTLARFRSLLIKKDFETIYNLMQDANIIKKILE
jgi:prephenate dehydrogenase